MRLRHTSIRRRVFLLVLVPLVATIAIYGYAVANQFSTAVGLSNAGKVSGATIDPVSKSAQALVAERDAAVLYMVIPSGQNKAPLEKSAAAQFVRDLGTLDRLRSQVAARSIDTTAAINSYSAILNAGVTVAE